MSAKKRKSNGLLFYAYATLAVSMLSRRRSRPGFTIVELLIVIVVIGILAAITIIAYNGITRKAAETGMQSDLRNANTLVEGDNAANGSFPATQAAINNGTGLKASGNGTISYSLKPYGYCIATTNPGSPNAFRLRSDLGTIDQATCQIIVSTTTGSGGTGTTDGSCSAAKFNAPTGVALGSDGTIYVSDTSNNTIRKISPSCNVSTFAGSGAAGYADGTGTAAQFNHPGGIAVDNNGYVYVVDVNNNRIRTITPGGVVTTLAGSGAAGSADGTGTASQFNRPQGLALDSNGILYVSDLNNNDIRKISPAGVVTTFAGSSGNPGFVDGTGTSAKLWSPWGVAIDSSNNVYVADYTNNAIRKISPAGAVTTLAGNGAAGATNGTGSNATFYTPIGIAVDKGGTVYVGDASNNLIRMVSPAGVVTTFAGTGAFGGTDGLGSSATFGYVYDLKVDSTYNVYTATGNGIRKIIQ